MPIVIAITVLMLLFLWYLINFQPSAEQLVSGLRFLITALACLAISYLVIPLLGLDINAVIRLISPILIVSGLYQLFDPTPSRKPTHQKQKQSPIQSNPKPAPEISPAIKEEAGKISKAELRLSTYLFYDGKQAARLVDGVQARFPDKTRRWCAEKALSDLERDRQMR
jgi:hypothetical protein